MIALALLLCLCVCIMLPAQALKTFIIEDNIEHLFEQIHSKLSLWQNIKISKIDKENHALEFTTKMTLYSCGEVFKINLKALDQNKVEMTVTSRLKIGLVDYNKNQKNISKFEEIINLQPSLATHIIKP